jgi:signal transduction histidine kinase
VRVWREGGQISVEVADDGPGFAAQDITLGHGLDTLIRRLDAIHGTAGRLEILPGEGAHVRFSLPATASVQ